MRNILFRLIILITMLYPFVLFGQAELVPVNHKIYSYLQTLSKKQIINWDNENIPISRGEAVSLIKTIEQSKDNLTPTEKDILKDLLIEFSYDLDRNMDKSVSLINDFTVGNIFRNDKQKYLYAYADENASLFFDGMGFVSYRNFNAESFNKTNLTLGQVGIRIRGTLYNTIGYYIRMSNGQQLNGDAYSRAVAQKFDPVLAQATKFIGEKYFDSFEGYLRYESENHAVALTFGRDNLQLGNGYIDKLFLSNNAPAFDFGRIDLKYKAINYTFFYGSIKGDSLGVQLTSKNIVGHRLDLKFSNHFRMGFFESIIISNAPISFTYLNPVSFLTSADFSAQSDDNNNSLLGIDLEIKPVKNIGVQLSLLIDDINFSSISKNDKTRNDNKFGYQGGLFYAEPFGVNDLSLSLEYTHLDPFVYSHRTNKSTFTHWGLGMGHALPPNSDEIALMLNYNLSNRIALNFKYKHQRSGEGIIYDDKGNVIGNYGGDVNRGDFDFVTENTFLMGNMINRDIYSLTVRIEPIRQFFIDINYSLRAINKLYLSQKFTDHYMYATFSIDF